ncbi:MAG: UDP-N-acetylmuramoyl-L-alanine--D-glutamate ligase [Erysipelotrichales bacterium]|nr:UDP-N-acetylmuramoyl-L-alanine--D-glutamate ligase [Erysipelotrichales bacterium]
MKKALILGYGISGKACYDVLKEDYSVYVYDDKKIDGIKQISKGELENELPLFDLTIRSPGFNIHSEIFSLVSLLSKEVISEIELGYRYLKNRNVDIIAVTGSNGKTTVVTLIGELLKSINKKYYLLGNIGTPLISKVKDIEEGSTVVLELSSFQLENIKEFTFNIAIITNITPNHLDHVPNYSYYVGSKKKLLQNINNQIVLTNGNSYLKEYKRNTINIYDNKIVYYKKDKLYYIDKIIVKKEELTNQSGYILEDISYALLGVVLLYGFNKNYISAIKNFSGVKYRQEVLKVGNTIFINDGKSTTVDSLNNAMQLYKRNKRIIILGGIYKSEGIENTKFKRDDLLLIYGRDSNIIKDKTKRGLIFNTLNEALSYLITLDLEQKVIIYSPSCSSLDQYSSYIERSKEFENFIKEHFYVSK